MIQSIHRYMQFGCAALRRDHPRVGPAGRALDGLDGVDRGAVGLGQVDDHLPRRAGEHRAALERGLLVGVQRPVLADERLLLLEQGDGRVELRPGRARTGS